MINWKDDRVWGILIIAALIVAIIITLSLDCKPVGDSVPPNPPPSEEGKAELKKKLEQLQDEQEAKSIPKDSGP